MIDNVVTKFVINLAVILVVVIGASNFWVYMESKQLLQQNMQDRAQGKLRSIASLSAYYLHSFELELIEKQVNTIGEEAGINFIRVINATDNTEFSHGHEALSQSKRFISDIIYEGELLGSVALDLDTNKLHADINKILFRSIISFLLSFFLIGGLVYFFFKLNIVSHIAQTKKEREKAQLASELSTYMKAIDQHALVSVTDSKGIIIKINNKFSEVSGYRKNELLGQDHNIVNSETHPKTFFTTLWSTISNGKTWRGEICNRAKNGDLYWVDTTIVPVFDSDGKIERYISIRIEITESKEHQTKINKAYKDLTKANIQLEKIGWVDGLTQISNRRYFDEGLRKHVSQLSRTGSSLTLILCDVDYFKNYNDTYGHLAGDRCLQQIAQSINSSFSREDDLVARYGGEEFVVILPNVDKETALILAEKMRENVAKLEIEHNASTVAKVITISVGVTTLIPDKDTSIPLIIEKADNALYMAKDKGRNNVQYL